MLLFTRLIPIFIVAIVLFALFFLYTAVMFALSKQFAFGLFNAVFAFAGLVLARALWAHRKGFGPSGK